LFKDLNNQRSSEQNDQLYQVEYITKILQHFRMEELKPLGTPLDINVQLTKGQILIIETRKLLKWKRYHIVRQLLVASCTP
jgi:hypothetical protein